MPKAEIEERIEIMKVNDMAATPRLNRKDKREEFNIPTKLSSALVVSAPIAIPAPQVAPKPVAVSESKPKVELNEDNRQKFIEFEKLKKRIQLALANKQKVPADDKHVANYFLCPHINNIEALKEKCKDDPFNENSTITSLEGAKLYAMLEVLEEQQKALAQLQLLQTEEAKKLGKNHRKLNEEYGENLEELNEVRNLKNMIERYKKLRHDHQQLAEVRDVALENKLKELAREIKINGIPEIEIETEIENKLKRVDEELEKLQARNKELFAELAEKGSQKSKAYEVYKEPYEKAKEIVEREKVKNNDKISAAVIKVEQRIYKDLKSTVHPKYRAVRKFLVELDLKTGPKEKRDYLAKFLEAEASKPVKDKNSIDYYRSYSFFQCKEVRGITETRRLLEDLFKVLEQEVAQKQQSQILAAK